MAVNTVDKLQFLSFIFAILLSITVNFREGNYASAHKLLLK